MRVCKLGGNKKTCPPQNPDPKLKQKCSKCAPLAGTKHQTLCLKCCNCGRICDVCLHFSEGFKPLLTVNGLVITAMLFRPTPKDKHKDYPWVGRYKQSCTEICRLGYSTIFHLFIQQFLQRTLSYVCCSCYLIPHVSLVLLQGT